MSIIMKDSDNGLGVIFTGQGKITENGYIQVYKQYLTQNEDKFAKYKYSLNDYLLVTEVEISSDAIYLVAKLCIDAAKINPDIVVALVANKDIAFGLSRMWEMLSDQTKWEIMVFQNMMDAEAWIREKVEGKNGIDDLKFS